MSLSSNPSGQASFFDAGLNMTEKRFDRLIGGLWTNLSEGRFRFIMVKDQRWEWIEGKPSPSLVQQS